MVLLGAVVLFVAKAPATNQTAHLSVAAASETTDTAITGPLDQVSSADIAVHVARTIDMPEANSVVNHADSVNAMAAATSADESIIAKPQVISGALPSRKDIHTYVVVNGDTISSIASKFGVSSDSIRWSNGLTGDRVAAGTNLVLPPNGTNGIVYTVKAGDTADSLAQKYSTDKNSLISFNDAEVSGLKVGEQILIPNGVVQTVVAPARNYYSGFAWGGANAIYSANGYDYGWCTWWAAKRRADIGRPIPSNLGNAISWRYLAPRAGLGIDGTPEGGAVAYYKNIGGLGHVGFVEQVNSDGSIWISDMNYYGVSQIGGSTPAGGWGRTSYHVVAPGELGAYLFIH